MARHYILCVAVIFLAACGPSTQEQEQEQEQIRELKSEIERLKTELHDTKFGAQRLLAQAKSAFDASRDSEARAVLADLLKRHPITPEAQEGSLLLQRVDTKIAAVEQERKREAEKQKEEERLAFERATQNLKKKTDEIEGITWISHKGAPVLEKYASLYFGTSNNNSSGYPIRLRVQYYDDDWLFVRSLTIKADDKTYELNGLDFKRDNSSGAIWEWVDMTVTDHKMLAHWMSAKRVIIRFHGDTYYSDFSQPQEQRNQMKEVYAAWKGLGGVTQ